MKTLTHISDKPLRIPDYCSVGYLYKRPNRLWKTWPFCNSTLRSRKAFQNLYRLKELATSPRHHMWRRRLALFSKLLEMKMTDVPPCSLYGDRGGIGARYFDIVNLP